MLKLKEFFELITSLQIIIVSTMIPVYFAIPERNNLLQIIDISINWQIPLIIFLTIIFSGRVVFKSFTIYIFLGLFVLPLFSDGGSLGYILTPNFGYLLGVYPLIYYLKELHSFEYISIKDFLRSGLIGILLMHLIGILYLLFQLLLFNKIDLLIYNIAKFSLSKLLFHLLMLFPTLVFLKPFKKFRI